jgi:hypothetical protein
MPPCKSTGELEKRLAMLGGLRHAEIAGLGLGIDAIQG